MFERYTEKARRVIFFGRYEASQFGSPYIETEHLLLGLLREDKSLSSRFLRGPSDVELIRQEIEQHTLVREKVSTSVDLPLSNEGKRVLAYAAEEAEALSDKHIGTEHLLLGLLREEKCFAAQLLRQRGLRLADVQEELRRTSAATQLRSVPAAEGATAEFSTNLTDMAGQHQLSPVVGRESEQQRLGQVLGRTSKRNPVLVGPRGGGKRSIVFALAQRIADGDAPSFLAGKSIVELDLPRMVSTRRAAAIDFASRAEAELLSAGDIIYFVPELYSVLLHPPEKSGLSAVELLKNALLQNKLQCISTASEEENSRVNEQHSWISRCFTEIAVAPATDEEAFRILEAVKARFEKHHQVTYTEDAIRYAVLYSVLLIKNRALPDKAIDLLDEAGSYVRSRSGAVPEKVIALRKKIRFIIQRMEDSIANHEFAKARFHSDEERSERENLRALEASFGIDTSIATPVTREIIEKVVAIWTGLPIETVRASSLNVSEGH